MPKRRADIRNIKRVIDELKKKDKEIQEILSNAGVSVVCVDRGLKIKMTSPIFDENGEMRGAIEYIADLTEKNDREELRELVNYLNNIPVFVMALELDGTIKFVNLAPCRAFGITPENIIGKRFYDVEWWAHSDEVRNAIKRSLASARKGEQVEIEVDLMPEDGIVPIKFTVQPLRNERGEVYSLLLTGTPVTELKKKEREIEKLRRELSEILRSFPRPVYAYYIDADGRVRCASDAFVEDYVGQTPESILGEKISDVLGVNTLAEEVLKTGEKIIGREMVVEMTNGSKVHVLVSALPIKIEDELVGVLTTFVDITKQKEKEEELIEMFKKFPRPGYMYFIDREGTVKYASDEFVREFVGYEKAEELIGEKLSEVLGIKTIAEDVLETGEAVIGKEAPAKTKDGKNVYLLVSGIPIHVDGELAGALGFLVDITQLKQAEKEIMRAMEVMEQREKELQEEKEYVENVVNALLPVVEAASKGDLTVELAVETRDGDALDKLVKAFEDMRSGLKAIIENLNEAVNKLSSASEELSASIEEINSASKSVSESAQKISAGAEEQTSLIEKSNKLMEEISGITEETASSAEGVLNIATEAEKAAMEGVESSNNVIRNMDSLAQANQLVTREVEELVKKAEQIGEIVDIITKIAEQTSLLALNANIEAARVGEQGRGFAVVAGEVGKLANETQESAKNIAELIKEIQEKMHKLAESVQTSNTKTEDAIRSVSDIVEKIEKIKEIIEETATGMREIKKAMDDQANAVQNLASLSDRVYQVALENAREVENTAAAAEEQASSIDEITRAAEELARMAENLQQMVQRFKA